MVHERPSQLSDFIANPRKALRLELRCAAQIEAEGLRCLGATEDLGARGCRLLAPAHLAKGLWIKLQLTCPDAGGALALGAVVVWEEPGPPWRHGVSFAAADRGRAEAWFDELAAHHSDLLHLIRVPDRLALKAHLYVTEAPATAPPLGEEEQVVLRLACEGPTLAQLQRSLAPEWSRAQRALFALLGRGALTLDAAEAADPARWRDLLGGASRGGQQAS